jgi:hypothetical protein
VEQGTQKNQTIIAPRPQYSPKREENDTHKGNGTTQNHPKRMTAPYSSFLLFHGYPLHFSLMAIEFSGFNHSKGKRYAKDEKGKGNW